MPTRQSLIFAVIFTVWAHCGSAAGGAETVSFRNDVMAVLSKAGCNAGVCHGNANGKGGFKLSLRGENPAADFRALTREVANRRTNRLRPERSLMLLKPTMQVAHEGGRRFAADSLEYRILHRWIAQGMPGDSKTVPRLTALSVTPTQAVLIEPRKTVQLRVEATFSDGTRRDLTRLAVYEPANQSAEVSTNGLVRRIDVGENTIAVRYLQQQVAVRLAFVPARPGYRWNGPKPANYVDGHIFAKLRSLRINPSATIDDATFIRRASLDLFGVIPTAEEARAFARDQRPDKRARLVDRMLKSPRFADFWAMKWSDLLRNEEKTLDRKGVQNYYAWIRKSIADGKPFNTFVRELIAARGSTYKSAPANYYRAMRKPLMRAESTAQLFLGVRLQCAKCHNHPFDRWTQDDYYGWANNFARVRYKIVENRRKDRNDKHEFAGEQIVYMATKGDVENPNSAEPTPPRFLGDATQSPSQQRDRLIQLADWVTSPKNRQFARSQVNRIWFQLMGRGIVDPIDDFRSTNPPVNPELLDALADDFVAHKFDIRHILRTIMNSRTYQFSAVPNATNKNDETNFSRAIIRRLSAEPLLDSLSRVVGTPVKFNGYPLGMRAVQIPGVRAVRLRDSRPSAGDHFLKLFGKPPRLQTCECERSEETTLTQTFQMVDSNIRRSPACARRRGLGTGQHERVSAAALNGRTDSEVTTRIERILAREVYDSRGKPTVEVEVKCVDAAAAGRAIVPSGASTGRFEAVELRDGDSTRLDGDGVTRAVEHVNSEIAAVLTGHDAADQLHLDRFLRDLDGTENKSRLGANAILGVSLACAHAAAIAKRVSTMEHLVDIWNAVPSRTSSAELPERTAALSGGPRMPLPMVNMISGGLHAGRNLDIQDVLILPVGAESYRQAFEWIVTIYRRLGTVLSEAGYEGYLVGDEGGYGPRLGGNREALDLVVAAIERANLQPGTQVAIGLDVAASHFFADDRYQLAADDHQSLTAAEFIDVLESWVDAYPIISIEDGLAEDDWEGWQQLTARLGSRVQLIGDDLFVTNRKRLERGIAENVANGILIKVNQIGTLWETMEAMRLAIDSGYWPVVSARSGETEDATIADLVVATGAAQIKVGSVARSERLAKYNQLLRIEESLGDATRYAGGAIFDSLQRGTREGETDRRHFAALVHRVGERVRRQRLGSGKPRPAVCRGGSHKHRAGRINVSVSDPENLHDSTEMELTILGDCLEAFLEAWAESDTPPALDEFLPENESVRRIVLIELIKVDLEYRLDNAALPKRLHEYLDEFPELGEDGVPADLIYEEFHLRQRAGLAADAEEYLNAFPDQTAELRCLLGMNQDYQSTAMFSETQKAAIEDIEPGDTLDDFELIARLGKGAFAHVFLARQISMQRLVAVKVSADHGTEPQTLAQLDHDHIVRVFDQRTLADQNIRLLYMQYVSGGTLQSVVEELKQTPPAEQLGSILLRAVDRALENRGESRPVESPLRAKLKSEDWGDTVCWIGARLAEALDYAHGRGVLHRDIKPANVLVTSEGVPKLADFNISFSSKLDGATPAAYFGGSLVYMSPEQLEASSPAYERTPDSLDGRSDVYSLAVMLWELLTGRRPFADKKSNGNWTQLIEEMIERRRTGIGAAAESLVPANCPTGLMRVLKKALDPDRDRRWNSASEFAQQLELCRHPAAMRLLDPAEEDWCCRWRKYTMPLILAAAVLPHVLPGVFNFFYNDRAIMGYLNAETQSAFRVILLYINGIAYPLGALIAYLLARRFVPREPPGDAAGSPPSPSELALRRRRCLGLGHAVAMVGIAEWAIAGVAYPVSIHLAAGSLPAEAYPHFIGSLALCGLIAAAYPFYLTTFVCFRMVYPCLLDETLLQPEDLPALKRMVQRAGRYLLSAVTAPFLGILAAIFVTSDDTAQKLALVVFASIGILGGLLAFRAYREFQIDVDALVEAIPS
eukprot:g8258.t1